MVNPMTSFSNPKLSKRLKHFSTFYQGQSIIWDIGCDHGQLGLSFVHHPHQPAIHLVDPALPVIKTLRMKLQDSDIPKVQIFHNKGQDLKLSSAQSHFIFIAGMGGPEIISILENLFPQLKEEDQVFISPHTKVLEVREFLRSQGECLLKEEVIFESGIWYPHFLLGRKGRLSSVFGDEIYQGEIGGQYREHLIEKLSKHRDNNSKSYLNFLKNF